MTKREILSIEKEILGIYVTGYPLENHRKQIEIHTNINTIELRKKLN